MSHGEPDGSVKSICQKSCVQRSNSYRRNPGEPSTLMNVVAKSGEQVVKAWPGVKRASFPWGKEGEHNECFDFGADQAARDDFLHHVKTDIASSSRVRIYSDARCSVH